MTETGSPRGTTIPRRIHQLWIDEHLPDYASESWRRLNPGWAWQLWTDADLLALVQSHYPALEALYRSYPKGVQRADLGRYLVLDHCGGLYADLDTQCLASLDVLADERRVVLSEEPVEHFHHCRPFGLERMYFNGIMAGPAGHPFWAHLLATAVRCAPARAHVLESTGPLMLTGAVESYSARAELALHSCHIFTPLTVQGRESLAREHGPLAPARLANHDWRGTWVGPPGAASGTALKTAWRRARYRWTRGDCLSRDEATATIDTDALRRPVSGGKNVAVLMPVRDAAPFLARTMDLLEALDHPAEHLSLTLCEGDSSDGSRALLEQLCARHAGRFRSVQLLSFCGGPAIRRERRWLPGLQRARRAHLARVRNHLIDHGLAPDDDWALWLDADVCDYPPDILRRLLAERCKIVTPDCRIRPGGPSYDLNAFADPRERRDQRYYKHVKGGLYMPPADHEGRRHLHDLRFLERVPLSSVGGTMLLVDAAVHRAGLRFPERPYDDLLETEGFGRMCRDFGVTPIGLPNLEILHAAS